MATIVTIAGREVEIAWTNETEKRFAFRASQVGGVPKLADLANPKRAAATVTTLLWLMLPGSEHDRYRTPEDLFVAIDHTTEAESIYNGVIKVLTDMQPTAEKKRSLSSKHSRTSSLASPLTNGKPCTRP